MRDRYAKPRSERERKELLGRVCGRELERAEGAESDDLQANREAAIRYYWGNVDQATIEGRSEAVSTDVPDMINAALAMIVPMLSTDAVVVFEPFGPQDAQAAEAESRAVNKVIMEECGGFIEIQEAVKDGLLMRNSVMKIRIEDQVDEERFQVPEGADGDQLAGLLYPRSPTESREIDGDELIVKRTVRRFIVSAVPCENVSYQAQWDGPLQRIRFFAERRDYTRSDLREMGVSKAEAEELTATGAEWSGARQARNRGVTPPYDAETRDQDMIECHECYQLIDMDGDGISERYRVLLANRKKALKYERVEIIPYAMGSPFINPHRITGESLYDHLKATQDVKTTLLRQGLDNTAVINNGRYAYDPSRVTEEDILNPVAGGGIRARDPQSSVVAMTVPDVLSGILAMLQYQDQRRTERGGAALELMNGQMQLAGETASGIERQYASREALSSMMAKNFSETMLRDIYRLTHEYMRRWSLEPVMVELAGQVVEMDPRQWPKRNHVNVTLGRTPGERGHMQMALQQTLAAQVQALTMTGPGVLVTLENIYSTAVAWLRLAGIDAPERHWTDPASPASRQAQQAAQQAQQQAAEEQKRLLVQAKQGELEVERDKLRSSERQHEADIQFKYDELAAKTESDEAKLTVEKVIDLEKQRMVDRNAASRESAKARNGDAGDRGATRQ